MFGIESLSGPVGGAVLVGIVLLEALVLYVGYGSLERVFGPAVTKLIAGE